MLIEDNKMGEYMSEVEVQVEGTDDNVELASDLSSWIKEARIKGASQIKQEVSVPGEGEMGGTLLAAISVILGSAAMVELVKVLCRWIELQHGPVSVTVKDSQGRSVTIEAENKDTLVEAVEAAKQLMT